jgi:DNA-binding transcriptional MerR regulator
MQLVRLVEGGAIEPVKDERGRGGRRDFSHENIFDARIAKRLSDFGVELPVIAQILRLTRDLKAYEVARSAPKDPHETPYLIVTRLKAKMKYQVGIQRAKKLSEYFAVMTRERRGGHKSEFTGVIDLLAIYKATL